MRKERTLIFCLATAVFTILSSGTVCAAQAVTAPPAKQISALADEFYMARAHYDPLNYATANGDSRFDDQIGMSISPTVRAEYFAHMHRLQKQLAKIPLSTLSNAEKLNEDILAFELNSSVDLQPYPEHLLPLTQIRDRVRSKNSLYSKCLLHGQIFLQHMIRKTKRLQLSRETSRHR